MSVYPECNKQIKGFTCKTNGVLGFEEKKQRGWEILEK